MEIKDVKIEIVDEESRLVLKRIITDKDQCFNRKIAVSNSLFSCEKSRGTYGKAMFDSPFQTHHIRWAKNEKEWDFLGLNSAIEHSRKNNRFFIPHKQRNENQWDSLKLAEADKDFIEFQSKVSAGAIPYPLPIDCTLEEWKQKKGELLALLNPMQQLMAVLSSKHNAEHFPEIVKYELNNSNLMGICSYEFIDVKEKVNLAMLRAINSNKTAGEHCALIVYFDYPRMLSRHSHVAGSFAYGCFSGDIFSERAYFIKNMSGKAIAEMMNKKPEDYYFYDPKQKGFNKSMPQREWYGSDLTRNFLQEISVNEGLNGHQAIRWINNHLQQKEFDFLNQKLLQKEKIVPIIRDYSRWSLFWDTNLAVLS
jgi:hypothetical protein